MGRFIKFGGALKALSFLNGYPNFGSALNIHFLFFSTFYSPALFQALPGFSSLTIKREAGKILAKSGVLSEKVGSKLT